MAGISMMWGLKPNMSAIDNRLYIDTLLPEDTYFIPGRDVSYMGSECHFCRGIVLPHEAGEFVLDGHGDHEVAMHRECAAGHDLIERSASTGEAIEVTCPRCGSVEAV